jgi:hypothetical protein
MRKLAVLRLLWFGSERNCLLSMILENALAACVVHYPCMNPVRGADYGSWWGEVAGKIHFPIFWRGD